MKIKTNKGLDLPITGAPKEELDLSKNFKKVALVGPDYVNMKPTMEVKEGDHVKLGQPVFACKRNEGLIFTAPASGKVVSVNRGERRFFQSLVVEVDENEEKHAFNSYSKKDISEYSKEDISTVLVESGEWRYLRQRPFEKVAQVGGEASSLFITAVDTNPLAPKPEFVIEQYKKEFEAGVTLLSKLPKNKTYVCVADKSNISEGKTAERVEVSGPHPAGNPGTHIHFVDPVNMNKTVWHIGYQDVIAIGHLFLTGEILTDKIITFAGPEAKIPRYLKVRRGGSVDDIITADELKSDPKNVRVISGSVLNGRIAKDAYGFLGAFSNQITCIKEDHSRELLGWHSPGFNKFSFKNIYVSALSSSKKFDLTSNTNGSYRAMVPIEAFEGVMPLDILPTQLLRALYSKDTDSAVDLGCLELAEEDLALATFVAPGKVDFPKILRENLDMIEHEGI